MSTIEIFADVWCPFAHVGIRALVARRRELGREDVDLWIRAWPLELVNSKPLDPHEVAHEVAALRDQVAAGLFVGFAEHRFPRTSLPALALAAAAYRRDTRTGEQVSLALRDAIFEEGRDIGDSQVLASIALAHDVGVATPNDHESVLADWREGQRRGVKGSPHFVCGGISEFCPSLDITKDDDDNLHIRANPDALEGFVTRCMAL
ncbi:MAG TPA: DsbA family protein [Acidimicrobiales bacterium]|nr:DsbA family protein [Acidimicrobiales bacterium]